MDWQEVGEWFWRLEACLSNKGLDKQNFIDHSGRHQLGTTLRP
jgi:hypothetical protein